MKSGLVIGIDVGGTFIKAALVDRAGKIIDRLKTPTETSLGKERVLQNISSAVARLEAGLARNVKIPAVGIGLPGIIDFDKGWIAASPNLPGWENFPIRKNLMPRIGKPLFVENDANAAALGEKWVGAARHVEDLCFITLGTGVGGGLILRGEIWHGADGMAGEIGHMTIHPDGPRCRCGNDGCLEMYASARAMRRMVEEALAAGRPSRFFRKKAVSLDGGTIHRAAMEGDRIARETFARMGESLGIAAANLINLLNLEMVILGGGLSGAWRFFLPALREQVRRRAFREPARRAKIARALVGEDAGVLGAARLAWKGLEN